VEQLFPGETALHDFMGRWKGGGSQAAKRYNATPALVMLQLLQKRLPGEAPQGGGGAAANSEASAAAGGAGGGGGSSSSGSRG
jgi:hypothetical protein